MKIAGMQPYFFPYLGYFGLIKHSSRFIIVDNVQYIERGWIERNRVLKPGGGWQYIRVPLAKHSHNTLIKDVNIRSHEPWRGKILRQLDHYKKIAPYFKEVIEFLKSALSTNIDSISELNSHLLVETCQYIGIPFKKEVFSEINIVIEKTTEADEWALNTCKSLKADTYLNPPNGVKFYKRNKYVKAGINLQFLKINLRPYNQGRESFEEALSIIDVMMFNSPQEIRMMLDDYELL